MGHIFTERKPHTLDTHIHMDQRTHILKSTPTTKSEISHPGKQAVKQIRDLTISDILKELRYLLPVHSAMNRDLIHYNRQPQACQGPHTFGTYTPKPLRNLPSWGTHPETVQRAHTLGHRFPLPSKSIISISGHRVSNAIETSHPGTQWPKLL